MNTTSTATKTNARIGRGTAVHATHKYGTFCGAQGTNASNGSSLGFQMTSDAVTCKRCLKAMAR
jgi:hypothetical protein